MSETTRLVTIGVAGILGALGIYGLTFNNYTPVVAVWCVTGPFAGALMFRYFGGKQ